MRNCSCLIMLVLLLSSASTASSEPNNTKPYAFVISGGVSLGSYEAGLNWAILKSMKSRRDVNPLAAVSGASAGGINSLATALSWCAGDELEDTIEKNVFRDIWIDIGIEGLLPKDGKGYKVDDGLLSRKTMDLKVKMLSNMIEGSGALGFLKDCRMPMGLTATRSRAQTFRFAYPGGASIEVQNDRFIIPLTFSSKKGKGARFENYLKIIDFSRNENIIFLQEDSGKCDIFNHSKSQGNSDMFVPNELAFTAINATSAFPVAFGPQELSYCINNTSNAAKVYSGGSNYFVDGGVFDNIPLGVAIKLLRSEGHRKGHFIYMDPDARRGSARREHGQDDEDKKPQGLVEQLSFLKGAYVTAREYELYNTLKEPSSREFVPHVTDRYPPLTGSYLFAFGAFLDRSFRLYDYYAGVYDGIHFIARESCSGNDNSNCMSREMFNWYTELGIGSDMTAKWLFNKMLSHEDPARYNKFSAMEEISIATNGNSAGEPDYLVRVIAEAFFINGMTMEPDFDTFLDVLRKNKKFTRMSGESLREILSDDNWNSRYALRASRRVKDMENGTGYVDTLASVAGLLSSRSIRKDMLGWSCKSSIDTQSNFWRCIAPYEASININGRGGALSHEFRYKSRAASSFNLRLTSYGYEGLSSDRFHYGQFDVFYENAWINNLLGKSYIFSSLGFGPSLTVGYNGEKEGTYLGGAVYLGMANDFLRITYGSRDITELNKAFGTHDLRHSDDHFLYLGITDISGLLGWLL